MMTRFSRDASSGVPAAEGARSLLARKIYKSLRQENYLLSEWLDNQKRSIQIQVAVERIKKLIHVRKMVSLKKPTAFSKSLEGIADKVKNPKGPLAQTWLRKDG